jgi:DNA-binding NtrC family response regulator
VRKFLKRGLTFEGFGVRVAENATMVFKMAYHTEPIDLIIIDPDFFDGDQDALIKQLQIRMPMLPVVIHSFQSDDEPCPADSRHSFFI